MREKEEINIPRGLLSRKRLPTKTDSYALEFFSIRLGPRGSSAGQGFERARDLNWSLLF